MLCLPAVENGRFRPGGGSIGSREGRIVCGLWKRRKCGVKQARPGWERGGG